jgi:phosphopantothenoylcysteine decarboxylase / phosphopantothenate---cysteine ligase
VVVGFAAETNDVEKHAREKLRAKALDLIAANDVSEAGIGFESEENALTVFSADSRHSLPRGSKRVVARELLKLIAARLEAIP